MFSYIFMKILESRPQRYDRGIDLLTWGHARRVIEEIVSQHVEAGAEVLDVGCGTGRLAAAAARKGARVMGVDISESMLAVARRRISAEGVADRVQLHHAGVTELDRLFEAHSFDLVTSTLVASELYGEERRWVFRELRRLLRPGGKLVLAAEVRPSHWLQRLAYFALRLPLALVTYLLAQTGTRAVHSLVAELEDAGFEIVEESRNRLGSFATLVAIPSRAEMESLDVPAAVCPEDDRSMWLSLLDFIARWFPNPVEPGLRAVGSPDRHSPVIVTANFHLTVRRVEAALQGRSAWLLVTPSHGINVWCASSGKEMTAHTVAATLKTSRLADRVGHRRLILPQLAAPGVEAETLHDLSGWRVRWGPVYVTDLPAYLDAGMHKTPGQSRVRFDLPFRLEMLLAMNLPTWLLAVLAVCCLRPVWIVPTSLLFWGLAAVLYAAYPWLPSHSGWLKALAVGVVAAAGMAFAGWQTAANPWRHWGWMVTGLAFALAIGFDLKGIVGDHQSEAEALVHRFGLQRLGPWFRAQGVHRGVITHDRSRCRDCQTCRQVCPVGVFGSKEENGLAVAVLAPESCLTCSACINQCPSEALSFR